MTIYTGGEGRDTVSGGLNSDEITSRGGSDSLRSGGGNDTIYAGAGDDTAYGDDGDDFLYGEAGSDCLFGGRGNDFLFPHSMGAHDQSVDYLFGDDGDDHFHTLINCYAYGGAGNDVFENGYQCRVIDGGDGNDSIDGAFLFWDKEPEILPKLFGGDGDDVFRLADNRNLDDLGQVVIDGGGGFDSLDLRIVRDMGPGFDAVLCSRNFEKIEISSYNNITVDWSGENAFTDEIINDGQVFEIIIRQGFAIIDCARETGSKISVRVIDGGAKIFGGALADSFIAAGDWDDEFCGNSGNDFFDGGDGLDTAIYSGNFSRYTISEITYNTFSIRDNEGSDGVDTVVDVNALQFSDRIVNVEIKGLEIIGDDSDDSLVGSSYADHVVGGLGNDLVQGSDGNDLLEGGLGDDAVQGGADNDKAFGDDGNDSIQGGAGLDALDGGADADTLEGSDGSDSVDGGTGNDLIIGGRGAGDDIYLGGTGIDTVKYTSAAAGITVDLSAVKNQAKSFSADAAGIGVDQLAGIEDVIAGNYADAITGNTSANRLEGRLGNDSMMGGGGADTLLGGVGADWLTGGAGRDVFLFSKGDSGQRTGIDRITDLSKGAVGTGDLVDYVVNLSIGGSAASATSSQAAINQASGLATFAAGSGTTLSDALSDIAGRFKAVKDSAGEFALFKVNKAGNFHIFISDGLAGVTTNDVVVELVGVATISSVNLTGGNLTITS